jgi:signal transduction histidine kinase
MIAPSRDPERPSFRGLVTGSLVIRSTLTIAVLIVGACVLLSVVLVRRHLQDIRQSLIDRGRAVSEFVAREAELGVLSGDVASLRQLATVARGQADVVYCRFLDRDHSLLVEVGDADTPPPPLPAEPSLDTTPIAEGPEVWEFLAPITTTAQRPHREELLADEGGPEDVGEPTGPRLRIGTASVGIALGKLNEQRRLAFVTAMLFTVLVALLAVASAALLMHGTLRALATAAQLAEERGRLAELKAAFVTNASHEFRTPLAVILACCNALQRYGARMVPDQQRRRLVKIEQSVRHMTELIDDVLTFGRAESGRVDCMREPVDVEALSAEAVADAQATATDSHRIALRCTVTERIPLDEKLVRQILRNLLANAVKYSPDGGSVWLEVVHGDGATTFRVTDEGIGITPEDQTAVFEPFHRGANVGKIPGSGLGLAITKNAVGLHGGTIRVESAPGRGTTFTVTLPDHRAAQIPSADHGAPDRVPRVPSAS